MHLNEHIEHTVLKPDTTLAEIEKVCSEAIQYSFAGVCIPPYYVIDAVELLAETNISVVTVIGFPYGYSTTTSKFEEMEIAMSDGAHHLDVVIPIAAVKNNDWDTVENEVETLTRLAHAENKIIKLIAETGLMSEVEIDLICKIAANTGVDYLKTSTGVNGPGATVSVVKTLRSLLPASIKIKASGGIRTREDAIALVEAGAMRIGASKSVEMMQ